MNKTKIILASQSLYKRQLLERLNMPFTCINPNIDESIYATSPTTRYDDKQSKEIALKLASRKAQYWLHSLSKNLSMPKNSIIIGCDQIANLNGTLIGKPSTQANAEKQLVSASAQTVDFFTAISVFNTLSGEHINDVEQTRVCFRELQAQEISRYLQKEDVLACAGSFKNEGLGITLFKRIESQDPTALTGLPLIKLTTLLKSQGLALP